jgi:hypothetical protein
MLVRSAIRQPPQANQDCRTVLPAIMRYESESLQGRGERT